MTERGHQLRTALSGLDALRCVDEKMPDLVICDIQMPGMDGLDVLREVKKVTSDLPVIIITAYATVDSAVQAMKDGAYDYVVKPFDPEAIALLVEKVVEHQRLVKENILLRERLDQEYKFEEIIGRSQPTVPII